MQECKVLFKLGTSRDKADEVVAKYTESKLDSFHEDRWIGNSNFTFGVITLKIKESVALQEDENVIRVEVLTTFRGGKTCEGGGCGCH